MPELWLPTTGGDPMTTFPRVETWGVSVLTGQETTAGDLDGVGGFQVDHSIHRVIPGTGSLDLDDVGQDLDWLTVQVQPWWQVRAAGATVRWPLGVFLCSAPRETWGPTGRSWQVRLMDRMAILDADQTNATTAVPAGVIVTEVVRARLEAAGVGHLAAITDSDRTLASAMVWEPGTPERRIINDLLASINYFSLRPNLAGQLVAEPYTAPSARPVTMTFSPGPASIHEPEFVRNQDLAAIPNRVVLVGQGTGDTEALVGVAENTDERSQFSYPRRGRWITHAQTGVEATSQSVIDALAARRLTDLSQVAATQDITHAAVPIELNAAVSRAWPSGEVRAVVQSWSLTAGVGAQMATSLREVL